MEVRLAMHFRSVEILVFANEMRGFFATLRMTRCWNKLYSKTGNALVFTLTQKRKQLLLR